MLQYSVFTMAYKNNDWLKVASLAIISLILAACGAGRTPVSINKTSTTLQDDIIQYGRQYLGKPYRYAGKGPNGFDCSGYTSFVFRKFGYRLDTSSSGQDRQIPTIARREDLRKGDLVFFEGRRQSGIVGHVGIVTEVFSNGHFKFIHSSTTSGVIISSSREPYYASRYLRGGRVLEENASYVTRGNLSANKKQLPTYFASTNKEPVQPKIPEVTSGETTESTIISKQTVSQSGNENGFVILVQTDPQKNPLLANDQSTTNRKKEAKDTLLQTKSEMVLRDEDNSIIPAPPKSHTVQSGETLYSISRHYGCTVEQLKAWNPQLKAVLKPGEALLVYTIRPE